MNAKRIYCVYNKTREAFLSLNVVRADTPSSRLKGLLGKKSMRSDEGLWVAPSRGVHTFGLRFSIDLVFLDSDLRVSRLVEQLKPFSVGPLSLCSNSVLELPTHTIYTSNSKVGDQLLICPAQEIGNQIGETTYRAARTIPVSRYSNSASERGTSLIEFALLLPVLLLLMLNAVNFTTYLFDWITINNAARAAAEYQTYNGAAVQLQAIPSYSQVQALVMNEVNSLHNKASVTLGICSNNSSSGTAIIKCSGTGGVAPPADPEPLHFVITAVTITYTYVPVVGSFKVPIINLFLTMPPTTITRQVLMRNIQ